MKPSIASIVAYLKQLKTSLKNRHNKINRYHVFCIASNHCVPSSMRMIYAFLTHKSMTKSKAFKLLDYDKKGETLEEDGTTLEAAVKALRKLGLKFKSRRIYKLKSLVSLEGKMVLTGDYETYDEPHAVVLYRVDGLMWLFDCRMSGAIPITDKRALRLINKSDENFRIERPRGLFF